MERVVFWKAAREKGSLYMWCIQWVETLTGKNKNEVHS